LHKPTLRRYSCGAQKQAGYNLHPALYGLGSLKGQNEQFVFQTWQSVYAGSTPAPATNPQG